MATYVLKRVMYSINKDNITYSDISRELGVEFPEDFKTLLRFENSLDADTHYWATTNPAVYMSANPVKSYDILKSGKTKLPVLVDNEGHSVLSLDMSTGKYTYNDIVLEDPLSLVNTILNKLDQSNQDVSNIDTTGMDGAQIEIVKQDAAKFMNYRDMLCMAFGLPTLEEQQAMEDQAAQQQ